MSLKDFFYNIFIYTPQKDYEFTLSESNTLNNIEENKKISIPQKIFPSLSVNLDYLKTKYNTLINSDIVLREFTINARGKQYNALIIYIDGMINSQIMNDFVLEPLMLRNHNNLYEGSQSKVISEAVTNNITVRKVKKFDLSNYITHCLIPQNSIKAIPNFEKAISGINSR